MNKKKILLFMLMMTMSFNINAAPSASFAETINNENIEVIATYDNEMPQEIRKIYKPKHTGEGVSYFDYIFIKARVSNLREKPDPNSQIVGKYTYDSKLKVLEKVSPAHRIRTRVPERSPKICSASSTATDPTEVAPA